MLSSRHIVNLRIPSRAIAFKEMFYLSPDQLKTGTEIRRQMCKPIDWDEFQAEKMTAWEKGQTGFPLIDAMIGNWMQRDGCTT